jgi:ceramide glucosyltransferase
MIAALLFDGVYLGLLAVKLSLAWRYASRQPRPSARPDFADVTILQPVLGGDPKLGATLAANLTALPGARFLWLVDHDDHLGSEAAAHARDTCPAGKVELIACPPPPVGENPKLHKLALAAPLVRTPRLAVLDDDTTLPALTLAALLDALDRGATLSTALPFYTHDRDLRSSLVGQFVNNQSLLTYLPTLVWHPPITINGMAYVLDTSTWKALGGFAPLTHYLTDDLAVARRVRAAGKGIYQARETVQVATTIRDTRHYVGLMHRWFFFATLLVRTEPPAGRIVILGLHGLPPLLLWCAILATVCAPRPVTFAALAGVLLMRSGLLLATQHLLANRRAHAPLASLLAELLQPWHLLHAQLDRTILWRSRRYRVRSANDFSPV